MSLASSWPSRHPVLHPHGRHVFHPPVAKLPNGCPELLIWRDINFKGGGVFYIAQDGVPWDLLTRVELLSLLNLSHHGVVAGRK